MSKKENLLINITHNINQWKQVRPDSDLSSLFFVMCALRLGKVIEEEFDRNCHERFGLGANDVRVLLALRRAGPPYIMRPTDLFRSLLITSGAVTKQVNRLSQIKAVERLADPTHGGGSLIQLSKKGIALVEKVTDMLAGEGQTHEALMTMSPEQRQAGLDFFIDLLTRMDQITQAKAARPKRGRAK